MEWGKSRRLIICGHCLSYLLFWIKPASVLLVLWGLLTRADSLFVSHKMSWGCSPKHEISMSKVLSLLHACNNALIWGIFPVFIKDYLHLLVDCPFNSIGCIKRALAHLTKVHFTLLRKWGQSELWAESGDQGSINMFTSHPVNKVTPAVYIHCRFILQIAFKINGFTKLVLYHSQEGVVVFAPGIIIALLG